MLIRWVINHFWTFLIFIGIAAYTKDLFMSVLIILVIHFILQVVTLAISIKKKIRLRNANFAEIDTMEGLQFEHYLKEIFKRLGYKVTRTDDSGDFGADLILRDGTDTIVVQAKRYKNKVGIKAVQEVIGSKSYYNATSAWVVTNSEYTPQAIKLAQTADVKLIGRQELADIIAKAKGIESDQVLPTANEIKHNYRTSTNVKCPVCDGPMVLRNGKYGVFYGCSSFPKCNGIKEAK